MSESQEQAKLYLEQQLSSSYPGMSITPEGGNSLSVEIIPNQMYFHIDANEFNSAVQMGQSMSGVVCNVGDLTLNVVLAGDENTSKVAILTYDSDKNGYIKDDLVLNSSTLGDAFSININNEDLQLMKTNSVGNSTVLILSMQHINSNQKKKTMNMSHIVKRKNIRYERR